MNNINYKYSKSIHHQALIYNLSSMTELTEKPEFTLLCGYKGSW